MQLQNKNRIAYLGALTLLFSYAELLIPKIFPFFRLGLGNIAILLALNLSFPEFLILTIIKSVCTSMMGGTLLSPFFLISISQSVFSGLIMFGINRIKGKWISLYGISLLGSAVSSVIQLLLSTLYLGKETFRLLGPMLLFSIISGIITALGAYILHIPEEAPELKTEQEVKENKKSIFLLVLILLVMIFCFTIKNIWVLSGALFLSFIFQIFSKRKILIIPHVSIWIFVLVISLFTPNGKVLLNLGKFSITLGTLLDGIVKALKLSIAAALSQCAASLRPSNKSLLGLTLSYYRGISDSFRNTKGNLLVRLQKTLQSQNL